MRIALLTEIPAPFRLPLFAALAARPEVDLAVLFLAVGGFDPAFEAYEDLDLYLRLSRLGDLLPVDGEPVTTYRLHGSNTPSSRLYEGALRVAEKHLPRTRGRARRLLLERRVDALWGLGRFEDARRAALRALLEEPRLLLRPRFAKRLAGGLVRG